MKKKIKKWMLRLCVFFSGIIFACFLAEFLFLLFIGERPKFPRRVVEAPWGLRYNEPNAAYRHKSMDGKWIFKINRQGMRAPQNYDYFKPKGKKRIITLGNSFTIGYEVNVEQTFSYVLEKELKKAGVNVEVLNCGVSGFSTAEAYLYYKRELFKYSPDLIILSFYINDLEDNIRTGLFHLQKGKLVKGNDKYVPAGKLANFLNTNWFFNYLSGHSNSFVFVKESLTTLTKTIMVKFRRDKYKKNAADNLNYKERLAAAIFEQFYSETNKADIPLIIQSIPSAKGTDYFPLKYFSFDRKYIFFFPAIKQLKPYFGKKVLYNQHSHGHWTPLSHKICGQGLSRLILENNLL